MWYLAAGSNLQGGTHTNDNWHNTEANRTPNQVNCADSTSNNFYLTGVQLELGSTATDFEHRSYGEELALCQRYFYLCANGASQEIGTGLYYSNSMVVSIIELPVPMRANPSVVQASQGDQYGIYRDSAANTFSTVTRDNGSLNNDRVSVYNNNEVSGTAGQAGDFKMINANGSLAFNAEL
jgi:hypothetical protein